MSSVPVAELRLLLFIAGDSPRSREATANLRRACTDFLDDVRLETVDVIAQPERADEFRILTTPTVVRDGAAPRRRVTGDLRDAARVLAALDLTPPSTT